MDLINYFNSRKSLILDEIRELVELESPTLDYARTSAVSEYLAPKFEELGATVEFHSGFNGLHLLAYYTPTDAIEDDPILFLGHLDTVWPVGTLEKMPFRIEDGRAYGPGIFDMKSSIVLMLESLRFIRENGMKLKRPARFLLTCDEESGSHSSRQFIEDDAHDCSAVFVFEPSLPGGAAKTRRKGIGTYHLKVHGIESHAGLDPEKGASAIIELAHQIRALHAMNDFERGVTVNVGVISGGTGSNVIAGRAEAEIDVRFWTRDDGLEILDRISGLQPALKGTSLELSGDLNRPPLERTDQLIDLYRRVRTLAADLGYQLGEGSAGGASDGNFTANMGIPTLDGLGVAGSGAHAAHEHLLIDDLAPRAALITKILTEM